MSNYVKQTWIDGVSALSAARMGVIEDGVFDAHFQPCARAYHNANQSISSGSGTALALNSERYDTDTIHDTSTNNSRLTCKTAGKYAIIGTVSFAANATGYRQASIRLNGTTTIGLVILNSVAATTAIVLNVSCDWDLAVNDYVELMAEQNSGGGLNVLSTASYSPEFSMHRIG